MLPMRYPAAAWIMWRGRSQRSSRGSVFRRAAVRIALHFKITAVEHKPVILKPYKLFHSVIRVNCIKTRIQQLGYNSASLNIAMRGKSSFVLYSHNLTS